MIDTEKPYYLVMAFRTWKGALEPVSAVIPIIEVLQRPGDSVGFCPVFASMEDAKRAYPDHAVLSIQCFVPPATQAPEPTKSKKKSTAKRRTK